MGFAGIGKSTPEPAGPCRPLRPGRGWGRQRYSWYLLASTAAICAAPRSSTGSRRTSLWLRAREPIFSETHTNEFCGIGKSTPEPAGPCAPLRPGRWDPSQAAVGPISYIAAFAWCPTVCRGTDDCGEHHPSTAAALAHPPGAQGNTPCAPRGGLCGCLAVRQTSSKPPGVPTGWGRLRAEPPGRASSWGA
ncbi:hypothetical protein C8A01DRAFT_49996 [Parachaetomium inaequale]|uniref:Uncharacterized protein n=1 Tax=Parachaetomium inaequale TaxID=2588326 RepID=A0AAN6SN98_9PEZI|nr:hypothetical protein C8A01DRAFT_49996 [Parachaetomium inaequale]